jgi:hypothetical protein
VPRARVNDLVPIRELPYRPAAPPLHPEAGQMAASDYVPIVFKNRLHLAGRPQMSPDGVDAPSTASMCQSGRC